MNPRELLDFLHIAERLKCSKRHCWNPDGGRESVAEHCWRTALMADLLREETAIRALLAQLPEPQRERVQNLFAEMQRLQTPEARLYKALDKLEALISHNEAALDTWLPLEYDLQRTYGLEATACHPFLHALRQAVLQDTEDKIKEADR